jgi:RNase P subunit RPR2
MINTIRKIKQYFCKHRNTSIIDYYTVDTCSDTNFKERDIKTRFQGGRYELHLIERCNKCGNKHDEFMYYTDCEYVLYV